MLSCGRRGTAMTKPERPMCVAPSNELSQNEALPLVRYWPRENSTEPAAALAPSSAAVRPEGYQPSTASQSASAPTALPTLTSLQVSQLLGKLDDRLPLSPETLALASKWSPSGSQS